MRVVLQRVNEASVIADGILTGTIQKGLVILAGIEDADTEADIDWLVSKIINCRIFNDKEGVMNVSLKDTGGDILLVSQFTLHASTKKGNRPSYIKAARPDIALPLYKKLIKKLEYDLGKAIQTGVFGADMKLSLVNDGPVTIIIDSKSRE